MRVLYIAILNDDKCCHNNEQHVRHIDRERKKKEIIV